MLLYDFQSPSLLVPMLVTSKWFTQYWSHVLVGPLCGALPVGVVIEHILDGKVLFVFPIVAVVPEPLDQIGHEPILILQRRNEPPERPIVPCQPVAVVAEGAISQDLSPKTILRKGPVQRVIDRRRAVLLLRPDLLVIQLDLQLQHNACLLSLVGRWCVFSITNFPQLCKIRKPQAGVAWGFVNILFIYLL